MFNGGAPPGGAPLPGDYSWQAVEAYLWGDYQYPTPPPAHSQSPSNNWNSYSTVNPVDLGWVEFGWGRVILVIFVRICVNLILQFSGFLTIHIL